MGIESGPRGGYGGNETPRQREALIEGEVESSFNEIDIDQAIHIPLPRAIKWQTASLTFREEGTYNKPGLFGGIIQLYSGQLEYRISKNVKKKSNLALTTPKGKPVLFTGTTNGFYAHDPLSAGKDNPFYVIGIKPYELVDDSSRISSIWHEMGHVLIFHTDADNQLLLAALSLKTEDLPNIAKAKEYGTELARTISKNMRELNPPVNRFLITEMEASNYGLKKAMSLFHERNAWASGIKLARANQYPTGFQTRDGYFDYARLCLSTYAQHYSDEKFVNGWK